MTDIARTIGRALRPIRPGLVALASSRMSGWLPMGIKVTSSAFTEGAALPMVLTADGRGDSLPLAWSDLPEGTASVALLIEDADIPKLTPAVHLIVHGIAPDKGGFAQGEIPRRAIGTQPGGWRCGRNMLAAPGWLPPSPPPGHGPHRYVAQVFALSETPAFPYPPGRALLLRTIRPLLLGQGRLMGIYERR
jgi:phosphatidylethanolamine-binding protein (PEBP) family uncharacterized protein